jgi:hypothetical protein
LPIGDEPNFFHCVSACSHIQRNRQRARHRRPRSPLIRYASAPSVVEPCMSSSDSPAHNSSYDLRLIPVGAQHEVTSPASNHLRVPARTAPLCLVSFRTRSVPSVQALRCTTSPLLCPGISADTTTHQSQGCSRNGSEPAQAHTNPIVPEGGFLQVAVSEAPVDSATEASSSLVGASDTALRLSITYPYPLLVAVALPPTRNFTASFL